MSLCAAAADHCGLLLGVSDVVFAMRLGDGAPTRAVGAYLIVGMLPWMAFCDALTRGMGSLIEAGNILQKNALPPMLFPVRAVLVSGMVFAPLLLLLVMAYTRTTIFLWRCCLYPLLLVLQWLLCTVWGAALAVLAAALRDTMQWWAFCAVDWYFSLAGAVSCAHVPCRLALGAVAQPDDRLGR